MAYNVWETCLLIPGFSRGECASWVQADGAILALLVAIGLSMKQWRDARRSEWRRDRRTMIHTFAGFVAVASAIIEALQAGVDILSDSADRREAFLANEYNGIFNDLLLHELRQFPAGSLPTVEAIKAALALRDACESLVPAFSEMVSGASAVNAVNFPLGHSLNKIQQRIDIVSAQLNALKVEMVRATHSKFGVLDS